MDPVLVAALAEYLARNCTGSISLQCGPGGAAAAPRGGPCPQKGHGSNYGDEMPSPAFGADCAVTCPEPDYSDPEQPYFWDHTTMCN